jgi:hypothetical protein
MSKLKLLAVVLSLSAAFSSVFAQDSAAPAASAQAAAPTEKPNSAPSGRTLWIAKFSSDAKAASAVANIQNSEASALQYSNLFDVVKSFATDPVQPEGTWTLQSKEISFSGGSAATRALVGLGAGRSHITMEYTLLDPDRKTVWTGSLTTKPSFWGSGGAIGAVQNQNKAVDEQAQKLIDALSKFLNPNPRNQKK